MKHLILILTLTLIMGSCRTKKETIRTVTIRDTVEVKTVVRDTIIQTREILTRPPSTNRIVINNPCDTLGVLKASHQSVGSDQSKATVTITPKQIILECWTAADVDSMIDIERISFREDKQRIVQYYEEKENVKKTITVWSKWTYIFLIAAIIFLLLLLSKFRKLIPTIF